MENILDAQEKLKKPRTNFKKWSLRLFIYTVVTNLLIAYKISNFANGVHDSNSLGKDLTILSIVGMICLTLGSIFTLLSYINKEDKNYQYKISIWGFPILIILMILARLY